MLVFTVIRAQKTIKTDIHDLESPLFFFSYPFNINSYFCHIYVGRHYENACQNMVQHGFQ